MRRERPPLADLGLYYVGCPEGEHAFQSTVRMMENAQVGLDVLGPDHDYSALLEALKGKTWH